MDRSVSSVPVQAQKVRAVACTTAQLLVRSWPEVAQVKLIQTNLSGFQSDHLRNQSGNAQDLVPLDFRKLLFYSTVTMAERTILRSVTRKHLFQVLLISR